MCSNSDFGFDLDFYIVRSIMLSGVFIWEIVRT